MGVTASAPAKVILFGEHFVVYGEPAVVFAIDKRVYVTVEGREDKKLCLRSADFRLSADDEGRRLRVEQGNDKEAKMRFEPVKMAVEKVLKLYDKTVGLDIEVKSSIPVAAGLGFSAAAIAAVTAATGAYLDVKMTKEEVFRTTYEIDKTLHGIQSGVDPAVSVFGGALLFQMDTGFKPLEVKRDLPLIVGYTGVERLRRIQIEKVKDIMQQYPHIVEPIKRAAGEIVLRAVDAFKEGNLETLGQLMNINHGLLYCLGVSDESLEWLINAARKSGALGAKLTGSGGGGCMIALAANERLENVFEAIQWAGGRPFIARKADEGVRIEQTQT